MNCISKKKMIFIIITIIVYFQMILVAFASDFNNGFEVKCTIEDIDKTNITIEIYNLANIDEEIIQKGELKIFDYLKANNIKPNISGYFNSNGIFTINEMDGELWLIKSGDFTKNNIEYKAIPQLIDSSKIGSLEIVETKYEFEVPKDSSVTYEVEKKWVDDETKHDAISVSIYHDNIIYDTVSLSHENNWTYKWSGLSNKGDWYVIENDIPSGYVASYEKEENTFIITNTFQAEKEDNLIVTILENLIPKAFWPQTGLESVLENIGSRIVVIILCVIVSLGALIIGKKINKTRKEN